MNNLEKRNILKSWCLRVLMAGIPLAFLVMLPEEIPFRIDVMRGVLMCLVVYILVYPAFSKAVRHTLLPKGIRYALTWCALCPLLWAAIAAVDLFYLQEMTLAVAFFVIVLFLIGFWFFVEVLLDQSKQQKKQRRSDSNEQYLTGASETSLFLTDSEQEHKTRITTFFNVLLWTSGLGVTWFWVCFVLTFFM